VVSAPTHDRGGASVALSLAVITGTFAVGWVVVVCAARIAGVHPFDANSFTRWDSGHYRAIALHGYTLGRCGSLPQFGPYPPDAWCGNTAWMPGFPLAVRAGVELGLDPIVAGPVVANLATYGFLTMLWFGFLRRARTAVGVTAMLLAAVFPGMTYQRASFPVGLVLLLTIASILLLRSGCYALAGLAAAAVAMAYSSGFLLSGLALAVVVDRAHGASVGLRVRRAATYAAPTVAAWLALLTVFEATTGHWDAWFKVQANYGNGSSVPFATYLEHLWNPPEGTSLAGGWIVAQGWWVLLFSVVVLAVTLRSRFRLPDPTGARLLALFLALYLVAPAMLGGQLSYYRSEALLAVTVPLAMQLRRPVLTAFTLSAAVIAVGMAVLFFDNVLI
jgi:hypothetical protein